MTHYGPGLTITPRPMIVQILMNQDDYNMLLLTILGGACGGGTGEIIRYNLLQLYMSGDTFHETPLTLMINFSEIAEGEYFQTHVYV